MHDEPAISPSAFIVLSMLLIVTGFALATGYTGNPGPFLLVLPLSILIPTPIPFYLLAFANPVLWLALLVLGLRRYRPVALWLLLAAPLAFYLVPFALLFMLFR